MRSFVLVLLATVVLPQAALAQTVPHTITFSARLSDGDTPITGARDLTFRLFDTEQGTTPLWTEHWLAQQLDGGTIHLLLGTNAPLDATMLGGAPLFLEVTVGETTLSPRMRIVSVPYAMRAEEAHNASTVGTLSPEELVTQVTAGHGLSGGGTGGMVTLSTDSAVVQSRVNGACAAGASIRSINEDGTVVCSPVAGDINGVITAPGSGLTGGADSGDVNMSLMACADGQLLRYALGSGWRCDDEDLPIYGAGLTQSPDGTVSAAFTPSGTESGTATSVARGDHVHDTRYATRAELAHTLSIDPINSPANPVSWNALKDVPSWFADGVDNDTTYFAGAGLIISGPTNLIQLVYGNQAGQVTEGNDVRFTTNNAFIQNQTTAQTGASFNIGGDGVVGGSLLTSSLGVGALPVTAHKLRVRQTANSPALLVTAGTSLGSGPIAEFRQDTSGQGIALGYGTLSASGPGADYSLSIYSKGTSPLYLNADGGGPVGVGLVIPDTQLTVRSGLNNPVRIGDTGCGSAFAGISLTGAMSMCSGYSFAGDATSKNLFLNRPTNGSMNFRMNNVDQMVLDSAGTLRVGTNNASQCDLVLADDVCFFDEQNSSLSVRNAAGSAYVPIRASAFVNASQAALKTDITALGSEKHDEMRRIVDGLPLYTYRYKEEPTTENLHTGLIVEDAPDMITSSDHAGVDLYSFITVTAGATKSISTEVHRLSTENARLARENEALKARLDRIEKLLAK